MDKSYPIILRLSISGRAGCMEDSLGPGEEMTSSASVIYIIKFMSLVKLEYTNEHIENFWYNIFIEWTF